MGRVHGDTHLLLLQGFVHTASSSLVFVLYRFFIRPSSPSSSSSSSPLSSSSLRRRLCLSYLLTLGITPLVWKDKTKHQQVRKEKFSDLKSFFQEASFPKDSHFTKTLSLSLSLSRKQNTLSPLSETKTLSDTLLSSFSSFFVLLFAQAQALLELVFLLFFLLLVVRISAQR